MNGRDDPWAALDVAITPDDDIDGWAHEEPSSVPTPHGGELIVVLGSCGGCGASTVAGGIALGMAAGGGVITLVDLDLAWGDLHGGWGVPRDRTLGDLAAVRDELTPAQIRMILAHHPSGVRLALSPGRPDATGDWDEDTVARLLVGATADGPAVVDVGRSDPAVMAAAASCAGRRLVVSPLSIRGARGVAALMDVVGRGIEVVVNHSTRESDLGIRGFRKLTGCDVRAELPHRPQEAESIGSGRRPGGRRKPLRDAVDALAIRRGTR